MTKSELIDIVAAQQDQTSKKAAEAVVHTVLEVISSALIEGDRVELRGFGSFSIRQRDARTGRNPKTGEAVHIPAKVVPHFKPGKELRDRVDHK
ncbi:MAG: integration host factor subunit beta [Mariprofundaceae bacterium]